MSPRELDILEDALEWSGSSHAWPEGTSPLVCERYAEYVDILCLYNKNVPLVEVDPDVLDPVFQEVLASPGAQHSWRQWFADRFRNFGIVAPAVTVVATACAMLWVFEPDVRELALEQVHETSQLEGPIQVQPTLGTTSGSKAEPLPTQAAGALEPSLATREQEASVVESEFAPAPKPKKRRSKSSVPNTQNQPAAKQVAKPSNSIAQQDSWAGDKDRVRSDLLRADQMRRRGDCAPAVKLYGQLVGNAAGVQRARALAGLSLCAEATGDTVAAKSYMQQANAIAPIDEWAAGERLKSYK